MEINGQTVSPQAEYRQLGLSDELLRAIDKKGYVQATPVQAGAIPYFMDWKDVIAKAPTGTGKTFAFGIPMVEHIDPENADVQALVLAPTRELAIQIQDELRDLCAFKEGVRVVCLYGGQPIDRQINQLKKSPQIVVATPGRLMDHMKRRTVRLDKVQTVVLDEADRMLDMGFVRDVTHILDTMPKRRNLGMFSATISREVLDISWVYQRDPVEITVQADQENRPDIAQYSLQVDRSEKADVMAHLLDMGGYERVIAFCNTKNMTDRLAGLLDMRGISCAAIHGDIPQAVREKTLQKFREGKMRVLVGKLEEYRKNPVLSGITFSGGEPTLQAKELVPIARAVVEHISDPAKGLGCKTLFATHYHELTDLEGAIEGVKNYNIAVKKRGEDITFLRRIIRGPADDSYGIEVAKLAGLPGTVTRRAHEVLRTLEASAPKNKVEQMDFDALQEYSSPAVPSEMMEKLEALDVETLTPIEALNFLYELKKTLSGSLNG